MSLGKCGWDDINTVRLAGLHVYGRYAVQPVSEALDAKRGQGMSVQWCLPAHAGLDYTAQLANAALRTFDDKLLIKRGYVAHGQYIGKM